MYVTALLLFLFINSRTQQCCHNTSICPSHTSCFCQGTVNACIYQVINDKLTFELNNETNYFNWVPFTASYLSITINFCSVDTYQNQKFLAGFAIQNSNGLGYPLKANFSFSFSGNCYQALIPDPKFCTAPSGGYCNLIISLFPITYKSNKVQIQISYVLGLANYITYILVVIGCILFLIIIILVGCLIYRRISQNNQRANIEQQNTIEHFDKYLPKYSLLSMIQTLVLPEDKYTCSVCLNQIQLQQQVRKTSCCHIFHVQCIDLWCVKRLSCPMCRQPLDKQSLMKKSNDQSLVPINIIRTVKIELEQQTQNTIINTH